MSLDATNFPTPQGSPAAAAPASQAPAASNADLSDAPELVIRARKGWIGVDWRELVSHRELLFFLIWRDVKVKYKQAILGVAWAIIVPVISVTLFTVIGKFAGFDKRAPSS